MPSRPFYATDDPNSYTQVNTWRTDDQTWNYTDVASIVQALRTPNSVIDEARVETPTPEEAPVPATTPPTSEDIILCPRTGLPFCQRCYSLPCTCCSQCGNTPCTCLPIEERSLETLKRETRSSISRAFKLHKHDETVFHPREYNSDGTPHIFRRLPHEPIYPRRYVSVEMEIGGVMNLNKYNFYNAKFLEWCEKWSASNVRDGSLPASGFEICTAPAKGIYFENQIHELCSILRKAKAWVNWRCGLHVHVDCRDLTPAQILRVIQVYAKIEDGLFMVVPDSRRRNKQYTGDTNFCEKCARKLLQSMEMYLHNPKKYIHWGVPEYKHKKLRKYQTRRLVPTMLYNGLGGADLHRRGFSNSENHDRISNTNIVNQQQEHYSRSRYYALNLHSYFYRRGRSSKRRTLECRLAAGTTDPQKIIPWARLWDNIIHVSVSWPTSQIKDLPQDPFEALLAVAPEEETRNWLIARREKFKDVHQAPAEDF